MVGYRRTFWLMLGCTVLFVNALIVMLIHIPSPE